VSKLQILWGGIRAVFFWLFDRSTILYFLKGEFVKLLIKKILSMAYTGGFRGWVIKLIAEELFEEIAEPIIRYSFRKAQRGFDVIDGELVIRRFNNAEDVEDWRDAVRDS
jgi:hypothetical protein